MEKNKSTLDKLIDIIAAIFVPVINLLSASGILKGILMILTSAGAVSESGSTYMILNAMGDSVFYFLPVLLAYTAAKRFGANPFTCIVLAGVLLYPGLTEILAGGETINFFGLPVKGATYHSSVIPIILAALLLSFLEKHLDRLLPEVVKGFLMPLLCIPIVGTVTLFAFGPASAILGEYLANGYEFIYALSPIIAGLVIGVIFQPMVIFGLHWSLMLISMNNIAVAGHDSILALFAPTIFAQVGASLAVMMKAKQGKSKSVCAAAAVSALFGITEPALFGVTLPKKLPLVGVCIGGGIGGALAGFSGAQASAFAIPSLATIPIFLGDGFVLMVISCVVGFLGAFLSTMLMRFDADLESVNEANSVETA